ncbi:MAG TPA: iron ABC transporter permease, partial [Candidatus Agrococcus pullicola]|nr:iron ABC transporter permease [Candidatus Agrococcus pullicola]
LGDDVARSLGVNILRVRLLSGAVVVVLAGAAVAAAGPIGFVGLAVPHIARAMAGADYRWIQAYAVLLGPILLLAADILGRVILVSGELQVGIITALLGAPVLIMLARRRKLVSA